MSEIYYSLSLKKTQKLPREIHFQYPNCDLTDLNRIINITLNKLRFLKSVKPNLLNDQIQRALNKIIPDEYFGSSSNRSRFYQMVKKILTQSFFECIFASKLAAGYDYDVITWLSNVKSSIREELLLKANMFLLEQVVKPLISHYYNVIRTYNGNEVRFVNRQSWSSFNARIVDKLKKSKFLVEVEDDSEIKTRGHLKIVPKDTLESCNFRMIVNCYRENKTPYIKNIASKIYDATRAMNGYLNPSLYDAWGSFLNKAGDKKLFGVKLDIKDAYGTIDISVLSKVISGLPPKIFRADLKKFVIEHINNQFVHFEKKIFQWKHGLLQGDHLSACLCELYMAYLDKIFLPPLDPDCFLHRTVDDYFFCSTEEFKVTNFVKTIGNIHEVNETKTKLNLSFSSSQTIPYCGKIFNLTNGQVRNLFKFNKGYGIRHRFKLWNLRRTIPETKPEVFMNKALSFDSMSSYFTQMEFNTVFNSQRTVLENFFEAMVYVAYKFDAAVMALRDGSSVEDFSFILTVLRRCVKQYSVRVYKMVDKFRGRYYKGKISMKLLKILAYKSFIVVFKRRNEIYKELISHIRSTTKLKFNFSSPDVDFDYFKEIPVNLRGVTISRKAKL